MPPRIHPPSKAITSILRCRRPLYASRQHTTQVLVGVEPPHGNAQMRTAPIIHHSPLQPPSYKPPEFRKSQLLRQYTSLLRSSPLILIFQHNNLKSSEWTSIRRELTISLRKIDSSLVAPGVPPTHLADGIKLQIIQTGLLAAALKVVEYHKPIVDTTPRLDPLGPSTQSSGIHPVYPISGAGTIHGLSAEAHKAATSVKKHHPLDPLLAGPLALLTFPSVSPLHLKTALSILSPSPGKFAAPTRRANPGFHEPIVQSGLSKLILLGARVEGKVFDIEGTKWVGGIDGGLDGLRAQLVGLLQGVGGGVTNVLESAGRSLYFTVEGRRNMLEEEAKGPEEGKEEVK